MVTALSESPVYVATITQAGYRWLRLTNVQVDNNMGIEERSICRGQNPLWNLVRRRQIARVHVSLAVLLPYVKD